MADAPSERVSSASSSSTEAAEILTMEKALEIAGWPASLLEDSKQPWVIDDTRVR